MTGFDFILWLMALVLFLVALVQLFFSRVREFHRRSMLENLEKGRVKPARIRKTVRNRHRFMLFFRAFLYVGVALLAVSCISLVLRWGTGDRDILLFATTFQAVVVLNMITARRLFETMIDTMEGFLRENPQLAEGGSP